MAAHIRFPVEPRDVPPVKAARRLHLTEAEFDAVREKLIARGFPRPDPDTGMYDLDAIDAWRARRHSGLTAAAGPRDAAALFQERQEQRRSAK